MANDGWQMMDGKWQMANGGWRMANGGWRMADGGWQMADDQCEVRLGGCGEGETGESMPRQCTELPAEASMPPIWRPCPISLGRCRRTFMFAKTFRFGSRSGSARRCCRIANRAAGR